MLYANLVVVVFYFFFTNPTHAEIRKVSSQRISTNRLVFMRHPKPQGLQIGKPNGEPQWTDIIHIKRFTFGDDLTSRYP